MYIYLYVTYVGDILIPSKTALPCQITLLLVWFFDRHSASFRLCMTSTKQSNFPENNCIESHIVQNDFGIIYIHIYIHTYIYWYVNIYILRS